jgi:hypothetical protein
VKLQCVNALRDCTERFIHSGGRVRSRERFVSIHELKGLLHVVRVGCIFWLGFDRVTRLGMILCVC